MEKASIDEAYLDLTAEVHKRLQENIENDNYLQSELFTGSFVVGSYALKNDDSKLNFSLIKYFDVFEILKIVKRT